MQKEQLGVDYFDLKNCEMCLHVAFSTSWFKLVINGVTLSMQVLLT